VDGIELAQKIFGDNQYPEISCDLMLELFGSILIDVVNYANSKSISLLLLIG